MERLTATVTELAAPLERAAFVPLLRRASVVSVLALAGLVATIGALDWTSHDTLRSALHSRDVARTARVSLSLLLESERALLQSAVDHDAAAHAATVASRRAIVDSVRRLVRLARDDPGQDASARTVEDALAAWVRDTAVASGRRDAPLRLALERFIGAEDALYASRATRATLVRRLGLATIVVELLALAAVLLALRRRLDQQAAVLTSRQRQLEEQALVLQDQAMELELQVEDLAAAKHDLERTVEALEAERARADTAARRDQATAALLDAALACAPIGFAFLDRELRYVRVNAPLAAMNALTVEEHIGRTVREVVPHLADVVEPALREVIDSGTPILDRELDRPTPTGELRHTVVSYFPIEAVGERLGVGVVVLDLTEHRRLEDQLRQAQKMEAVGRLAGGIAHDFNNLLTVIRAFGDLLALDLDEDDPRREHAVEIRAAADRATGLTRQLLAFSRKQMVIPVELDLSQVVAGVEEMLHRLFPAEITLVLRLGQGIGHIRADVGQIEQVLLNLVINAADAMPRGGRIEIATSEADLDETYTRQHANVVPGRYAVLSVTDTGHGMDDATRARIFEPFFTTKPQGKGTGLGLATVYGIVKQSRGHVWVYSEPGHGTTFKIYFPVRDGALPHASPARPPADEARGTETILLVEDDERARQAVRRSLERRGYTVLAARDGAEALRTVAAHAGRIHLLLADLVLPDVAGRELAVRVGAAGQQPRVLFMSGYPDDEALRRGFVDTHHAFIEKPFSEESLARRLRSLLDGEPAATR